MTTRKDAAKRAGPLLLAGLFLWTAGLFGRPVHAEEKAKSARWEKEIAAFEQRDKDKPPPKNAVLFVGSSTIRRWDLPKSFPGLDTINRGFGGSQLADAVYFAPRIILKYQPCLVVLYAGDNDLAAGKSPEQVFADFQAFVKVVRQGLPRTTLLYLAIKPSIRRWALIDKIRKTNALIEEQCQKEEGVVFIDPGKAMLGDDRKPRPELFVQDGLHLSEKGYALWVSFLKPYLK
jgi:lysophospholipase L1-like esterase